LPKALSIRMISTLQKLLGIILTKLRSAFMDLVPIIGVVAFFQLVVIQKPFPNLGEVLIGTLFVVIGLMLFIEGLTIGLFPIGESLAHALAHKGSMFWLLLFAFFLGFSTTIAEPALIAIAQEAARVAADSGYIQNSSTAKELYSFGLRITVALSVGLAIVTGVIRIIKGWPIYYFIIGGYILVLLMTMIAPAAILGLAFDSGGVTTSTITVPLVTALGVGLASVLKNRSPLLDGFGLIAFASLFPIIFVILYGILIL
jgi:hypothetical protein